MEPIMQKTNKRYFSVMQRICSIVRLPKSGVAVPNIRMNKNKRSHILNIGGASDMKQLNARTATKKAQR